MKASEILGHSEDARLLIINIDDYGLCYTANDSAIRLLRKGAACSCTVMAPAPWSLHGIALVKENSESQCGVHLTAISEHMLYRWRPLSPPERVPSLIDPDGYLFLESQRDQLIRLADVQDLEREFRAQIEFVIDHGVEITHLDSHCDIHDARDDIFDMSVGLAKEYGVALRVDNPGYFAQLKKERLLVIDNPYLDSFRIPLQDKTNTYLRLLKELPPGLSEWAIHPAYESAELRALTPEWPVRATDDTFFNSDEFMQTVNGEGIELVSYRSLQPFWKNLR
jgi:hypothetical protein